MSFNRSPAKPLLTRQDVPDLPPALRDVSSVFNPGAIRLDGTTTLLCRVQTRGRRTVTWAATSSDGLAFEFAPQPAEFLGLDDLVDPRDGASLTVFHNYDPRITYCEGHLYVVTALDTNRGCRLAIWRTDDFSRLHLVGLTGDYDTRNGVLFPQLIGGRFAMLERPNTTRTTGGPTTGNGVRLITSADLTNWRDEGPVFGGQPHYWDELVGSGPPPLATEAGWLHIYHGVATHFQSANIYQAGAVLLDRDDPTVVLGRTRENILEPRLDWEVSGQVPNVVFPSGLTTTGAGDKAVLNLYYGAADTVIGRATAPVANILAACL